MNDTATTAHPEPLTLERVYRELQVLRDRVEDLEDLRELEEAITENGNKPLVPWASVRQELEME